MFVMQNYIYSYARTNYHRVVRSNSTYYFHRNTNHVVAFPPGYLFRKEHMMGTFSHGIKEYKEWRAKYYGAQDMEIGGIDVKPMLVGRIFYATHLLSTYLYSNVLIVENGI